MFWESLYLNHLRGPISEPIAIEKCRFRGSGKWPILGIGRSDCVTFFELNTTRIWPESKVSKDFPSHFFWLAQIAAVSGVGVKKWLFWSVHPHPIKSQFSTWKGVQNVEKTCSKSAVFNLERGVFHFPSLSRLKTVVFLLNRRFWRALNIKSQHFS